MHSYFSRLNAIFAFALSVVGALATAVYLSTAFADYSKAPVHITVTKAIVKRAADYTIGPEKRDLGILQFDLEADLTKLFDWNCKQLFVYLAADYETGAYGENKVVIWDRIIQRNDNKVLTVRDAHTKYYFFDESSGLVGHQNVTLVLGWNVIPHIGALADVRSIGAHRFSFPAEYSAGAVPSATQFRRGNFDGNGQTTR